MQEHYNPEVQAALTRLAEVLAENVKKTGLRSVLIFREQGGFTRRFQDGKPFWDEFEPTDAELVTMTLGQGD